MGILPRRGRTDQPRATPWDLVVKPTSSPERAAHGPSDVSPFQGSGIDIQPDPRALPWADLWLPLRGDRQRYRYRCYSLLDSGLYYDWVGRKSGIRSKDPFRAFVEASPSQSSRTVA